jgi:hypothetical protein
MKPEIKLHIKSFPSKVVVIPKFLLKTISKYLKDGTEHKYKKKKTKVLEANASESKASVITLFGKKYSEFSVAFDCVISSLILKPENCMKKNLCWIKTFGNIKETK